MAEFLWTFAVQEVLKKVLKVAAQQIGVAWGFKKELSELTQWLTHSEAILRGINTKNESVRVWVDHLQHLVYEADDLLDELVYEDLRQKMETGKRKMDLESLIPRVMVSVFVKQEVMLILQPVEGCSRSMAAYIYSWWQLDTI